MKREMRILWRPLLTVSKMLCFSEGGIHWIPNVKKDVEARREERQQDHKELIIGRKQKDHEGMKGKPAPIT